MHRLEWAHWEIMQNIFPNLERLVTVFQHGDWRCRRRRLQRPDKLINIVPDLGWSITLWQGKLRSLTVTGFFSNNGKMMGDGYHNNLLLGYRWLIADMSPFLWPGLPQVPLTELTTDCVWLFGRVDPSVAYQIPSLIPSSLASLHLIDYWAVPIDEEVFEEGEWLRYYPAFPSGRSAFWTRCFRYFTTAARSSTHGWSILRYLRPSLTRTAAGPRQIRGWQTWPTCRHGRQP